ncbi:HAD family hydrolase [Mesorhizobium ventifaucium]|uniref:phosphoglycolate phosphatase n=1 Tax=Mesorhizobium ventifaucium TaxID=666020 RepID=A0ABM9DG43_9HYPH|nr:HAD family hydrolase [Mesorhizobium ventifaucium]CAH2395191.1 Hydrolase [Mesorhizobium ventifaucium]
MGGLDRTFDWAAVDLVIFDVDGTLYDQRRLRQRMLIELGAHCCRTLSFRTALTLRAFRRCREDLSRAQQMEDITDIQYRLTAAECSLPPDDVRTLVKEWIEERPLRFLRCYRFNGVAELFDACAGRGKTIAVWSDYPASAKLVALDLVADIIASSGDDGVRRLKPDPAGLYYVLACAGVPPQRAVLIGDRAEHDGEAARRAGVQVLLRRAVPHKDFPTFRTYHDSVFEPLLSSSAVAREDSRGSQ